MPVTTINELRDVVLAALRKATRGDWKVLVMDETTAKVVENAVKTDDILNENITNIERIEERREMNPDTDVVYILSPQPYLIDFLLADFDVGRYRKSYLIWTALLAPELRHKLEENRAFMQRRNGFDTVFIDFYPRESRLVTFRDPWSFPILYHPSCNNLVRAHLGILAQKIMSVCVLLGEYPRVRYYKPREPTHEASVLCQHLARFVQEELAEYASFTPGFGDGTGRPQGVLVITDRSMDLMAPLLHEFTYQAMAHDLLPIKDTDKVRFSMLFNEGRPDAEEKDMELHDGDKVWVENRHRHMKDTIDKLMADFNKFIEANPHFAKESNKTNLKTIKDMLAGLPQFQVQKDAYSLHINMAQKCMNAFQAQKLLDLAALEQTLSTGLDEDYKKPKNILDEVVRLLDDPATLPTDRLRLIMIWTLYRDGVIKEDIKRLLAHSKLPVNDGEAIVNLDLLGGRSLRNNIKDVRAPPQPLFAKNSKPLPPTDEDDANALSRYETAMQTMLEELCKGTLDSTAFPHINPPADPNEDLLAAQAGSLRAGRPNWASTGRRQPENLQRIMVFLAGGATFSESRTCYEVSAKHNRDIVLVTSHMLTPQLFIRQLGDLTIDRRKLDLPMDRLKPKVPAYLLERPPPPLPKPPLPMAMGRGAGLPPVNMSAVPPRNGFAPPAGGPPGVRDRHSSATPPLSEAMAQMSLGGPRSNGSEAPPTPEKPNKEKKRRFLGIRK